MPLNWWLWSMQPDVTTVGSSLVLPSQVTVSVGKSVTLKYDVGLLVALTYQWCRDGVPIAGATGTTYVVTTADRGAVITVIETATNLAGVSTSQVSNGLGPVPITVGVSLVMSYGMTSFAGRSLAAPYALSAATVALTHQWLRNGVAIPGATDLTYLLTDDDAGAIISVRETATVFFGGGSASALSNLLGPVLARVFQETLGSQIFGNIVGTEVAFEVVVDTKYADRFFAPPSSVPKLTILVDGLGSGIGSQKLRGVIYDTLTGLLLGMGDEVTISDGQALQWIDLPFGDFPGGVDLEGDVEVGVLGGATSRTARIWGRPAAGGTVSNADTYADGAAASFGASSPIDMQMAVFATFVLPSEVAVGETEFYYARLPFTTAQHILDTGKLVENSGRIATCGWHGTRTDPERGSFAVVNADGPLADLVGERLKISVGAAAEDTRSVFAYCHTRASVAEDLSVPRRLFFNLAVPGDDSAIVNVEVVA